MIDNLVSNHLLPAYMQNRAHSRHYRSEYVRGYLHRQAMCTAQWKSTGDFFCFIVFCIFAL